MNRAFAEAYFKEATRSASRLMAIGGRDTIRIVGVVGDVPIGNLGDHIPPTLYIRSPKIPRRNGIAVRTQRDVGELSRELDRIVAAAPRCRVVNPVAMERLITNSPSVFMRRFPLLLVGAFAAATLVLALVGIYGVVSYSVAQRTREMGIRVALGAQPRSLVSLVMRHGGWMAIAGVRPASSRRCCSADSSPGCSTALGARDPATLAIVAFVLGGGGRGGDDCAGATGDEGGSGAGATGGIINVEPFERPLTPSRPRRNVAPMTTHSPKPRRRAPRSRAPSRRSPADSARSTRR